MQYYEQETSVLDKRNRFVSEVEKLVPMNQDRLLGYMEGLYQEELGLVRKDECGLARMARIADFRKR
ncbi:MAG: hypothetical protein LBM77_04335 [Spirochaetaceae bacterium]|jgi:hypothetical protein|nr:hypothetical protein [Spirochaetaceae bacterium]